MTALRLPWLTAVLVASALVAASAAGASAGVRAPTQVSAALAQDDDFCLGCHGTATHAKDAPLVDRAPLVASAHAAVKCSECHTAQVRPQQIADARHLCPAKKPRDFTLLSPAPP